MSNLATAIVEKKPIIRMAHPSIRRGSGCHGWVQDEERHLQRKEADGGNRPGRVPAIVHNVLRSPGEPLDPALRTYFEPRFGQDFSRVRVHTDDRAAESARAVRALAYTVGNEVVFGRSQYAPETDMGRRMIAHELAHVVQQASASKGVQTAGVNGSGYDRQEQEAEVVTNRIAAGAHAGVTGHSAVAGLQRWPMLGGVKDETDACSQLENDRESFSIAAARHFLTEVDPGANRAAKTVECHDNPVNPERLECVVAFADGNKITVTWLKDLNNVEAQRQTNHGREWCVYHYSCDSTGSINYSKKGCSSDYQRAPGTSKNLVG